MSVVISNAVQPVGVTRERLEKANAILQTHAPKLGEAGLTAVIFELGIGPYAFFNAQGELEITDGMTDLQFIAFTAAIFAYSEYLDEEGKRFFS